MVSMKFLAAIVIGILSTVVILTVVIVVSIHFTRKANTEGSSTEPSSDTTISTTPVYMRNTTTSSATTSTTTSTITTTTSSTTTTTTTSTATTTTTSITTTTTSSVTTTTTTSITTTTTSFVTITTTTSVTTTTTSSITTSTTSSTKTTSTSSRTTSTISSTRTTSTTSTTSATTTSKVCSFGFEPMVLYATYDYIGPTQLAVGYFNNDSYIDIAIANYNGPSVGILLGVGDGSFLCEIITFTGNNTDPIGIAVGDFNNDKLLDVVIASLNNWNIVVLLGNGDGTFQLLPAISTGSSTKPYAVAVGYIDKDNILDIVVPCYGGNKVLVYLGYGDGTFQSPNSLATASNSKPSAVALGDLNNDNNMDIVTSTYGTYKLGVFLGYGNGSFRPLATFTAGTKPSWIGVADFNADKNLDVAVLNKGDSTMGIFLGLGNGTFQNQTTYKASNNSDTYFFGIGDINNDGKLDILIPNWDLDSVQILLGQGDGTFQAEIFFSIEAGSAPTALAVSDFNRDNRPDIAVTNINRNNVGVFIGTC